MNLDISTPALLFPAVSLLFLSFTNRFLHLAALIRHLHRDWLKDCDESLLGQIKNIRQRLKLIRWMQLLGALSLLLCVISMMLLYLFPACLPGQFPRLNRHNLPCEVCLKLPSSCTRSRP